MNFNTIHQIFRTASGFLASGKIKNAFEQTELLLDELQSGKLREAVVDLQQNYRYMLQYYISGIADPDRRRVYNKLTARLYELLWDIREELMDRYSPSFEYGQKRYFRNRYNLHLTDALMASFQDYHAQTAEILDNEPVDFGKLKTLRAEYETLLPDLFAIFWLLTHYSESEKNLLKKLTDEKYAGMLEKTLAVTGITLNLWRMFDEEKLLMLLDLCRHPQIEIQQRAMAGLCFVLAHYNRFIPFFPQVRNKLILLADDEKVVDRFKNIFIRIISTLDTEKISQKFMNEIMPEMMKIAPQIQKLMETDNQVFSEEWDEEKPEWQDFIENSPVADKLQEISELQIEGEDVYMGTFAQMKGFGFFSMVCNWFLPFDTETTAVSELFSNSEDGALMRAFASHTGMCNSDKYSFCLAILTMAKEQRGKIQIAFKTEAEQIEDIINDEKLLQPDIVEKNIAKQYIWDLFRFFKLFPQRGDFADMFQLADIMHRSYLFDLLAADNADIKAETADYYFRKKHYSEALSLYDELKNDVEPSVDFFQKIAYAYQKTSQIGAALDAYLKADIINPDDLWNVRKIALCCKLSGDWEKALEYYSHAEFLSPDDLNIKLQKGKCLETLDKLKQAADLYVKLDTENANPKIWRALVLCALKAGNLAQADFYIQRLLEEQPEAVDYLYAGHILWCKKRLNEAADSYIKYYEMQDKKWETLHNAILRDRETLQANGIDNDDFRLMLDELQYKIEN